MPFFEELRRAAEVAPVAALPDISRQLYAALGTGAVTEAEVETIGALIQARQQPARDPRAGPRSADAIALGCCRSIFPPKRIQRSPDRSASRERRRRIAMSGPMPPTLAWKYTVGQLAALGIVADEVRDRGVCDLPVDAIAARAGVSRRLAQQALRLAEDDGLLTIRERPRQGDRHLTNEVRVLSREWRAWIAHGRGGRVQKAAPHGYSSSIPATAALVERSDLALRSGGGGAVARASPKTAQNRAVRRD